MRSHLNAFHLWCLSRILGVKWQDHVTNSEILSRTGTPSMYSLLSQRRLRWLGHVHRMNDWRILKDVLHEQLTTGESKLIEIDPNNLEVARSDRACWRRTVKEVHRESRLETSQESWEETRTPQNNSTLPSSDFICAVCSRDCHSHIRLHSHTRRYVATSFVSRDFACQQRKMRRKRVQLTLLEDCWQAKM